MDLIHIDLLGLETIMNTKVCPTVAKILVIMDHFSCHMQAYKVNDESSDHCQMSVQQLLQTLWIPEVTDV